MPKKKKSFIDKHQSTTFAVVHRARRDPLSLDDSASPHVLQPTFTGNQRKKADRERHSAATAPADLGDFDQSGRDAKGRLIGRFGGSEMGPGAQRAMQSEFRRLARRWHPDKPGGCGVVRAAPSATRVSE